MTNRSQRRSQGRLGPRRSSPAQRRMGLRLLILVAVVGLVLLAVASLGAVSVPAPTPIPTLQ
jgi:hypothetical protein